MEKESDRNVHHHRPRQRTDRKTGATFITSSRSIAQQGGGGESRKGRIEEGDKGMGASMGR